MPKVTELKTVNLGVPPLSLHGHPHPHPAAFLVTLNPCTEHKMSVTPVGRAPAQHGPKGNSGPVCRLVHTISVQQAFYPWHIRPSVRAISALNSPHCLRFLCLHAQSFTLCSLPLVRGIISTAFPQLSYQFLPIFMLHGTGVFTKVCRIPSSL